MEIVYAMAPGAGSPDAAGAAAIRPATRKGTVRRVMVITMPRTVGDSLAGVNATTLDVVRMLETRREYSGEGDTMTRDVIRRLPKTDLHVHLDGSLRLGTLIELARGRGVELPPYTEDGLRGTG